MSKLKEFLSKSSPSVVVRPTGSVRWRLVYSALAAIRREFTEAATRRTAAIDLLTTAVGSEYAAWISFDNDGSTAWHFNHTTNAPSSTTDIYSIALHEIVHVLGLSTNWTEWTRLTSQNQFRGPDTLADYNGDKADGVAFPADADAFERGQTAMFIRESWVIGDIATKAPDLKYATMPLPMGSIVAPVHSHEPPPVPGKRLRSGSRRRDRSPVRAAAARRLRSGTSRSLPHRHPRLRSTA